MLLDWIDFDSKPLLWWTIGHALLNAFTSAGF